MYFRKRAKSKADVKVKVKTPAAKEKKETLQESLAKTEKTTISCACCMGTGDLITCEKCLKSFHPICTDPPLGQMVEGWHCNECRVAKKRKAFKIKSIADVWKKLKENNEAVNSKIFCLPKKIRKLAGEPEFEEEFRRNFNAKPLLHSEPVEEIPARQRLTEQGYCHHCGRCGQALLINCDECSLKWHLDCLPYPLPFYPSPTKVWSCPIHLCEANLVDFVCSEERVERIISEQKKIAIQPQEWPYEIEKLKVSILPESSIRLDFGNRFGEPLKQFHECKVPIAVREVYSQHRRKL